MWREWSHSPEDLRCQAETFGPNYSDTWELKGRGEEGEARRYLRVVLFSRSESPFTFPIILVHSPVIRLGLCA